MDYTINSSPAENQLPTDVRNHGCKSTELFNETERKENNNYSNSLKKTEVTSIQSSHPGSLFRDDIDQGGKQMPANVEHCQYGNCKKAIDLSIHSASKEEERSIFDDAEYFFKNHSYKLLPINFESVDETIINSEHNYCNISQSSGSECEEDCSRTMDYNQVKEKNYKKRKSKYKEDMTNESQEGKETCEKKPNKRSILETTIKNGTEILDFHSPGSENCFSIQPLDLSAPLVQDEKTEKKLEECINVNHVKDESTVLVDCNGVKQLQREGEGANKPQEEEMASKSEQDLSKVADGHNQEQAKEIANRSEDEQEETIARTEVENERINDTGKDDSGQFDSDKENQRSKNLVEVTIARGDGKKNYQPCDSFLSDIARLVPKIIKKDCSGIDILDHTCDSHVNFKKHRLYYVISESTWRLFQNANERVILTNDRSLGQPVQSLEKDDRPTYLIFDQFSLAKCLADYCKEIGGCFEYLFVEEDKQESNDSIRPFTDSEKMKQEDAKQDGKKGSVDLLQAKLDSVPSVECQDSVVKVESFAVNANKPEDNPSAHDFTLDKKEEDITEEGPAQIEERGQNEATVEGSVEVGEGIVNEKQLNQSSNLDHNPVDTKKSTENTSETNLVAEDREPNKKRNGNDEEKLKDEVIKYEPKNAPIGVVVSKEMETATTKRQEKSSEAVQHTTPMERKRNCRGSSSNLPVVSTQDQKKRTLSSRPEEKNVKKFKGEEELPERTVRTRSKSASETELAKTKSDKRVTSQKSDNSSENSRTKATKRNNFLSENGPKPADKAVDLKGQKPPESATVPKDEKRKTRSESSNAAIVTRKDSLRRTNKDNTTNNNLKKPNDSVINHNNNNNNNNNNSSSNKKSTTSNKNNTKNNQKRPLKNSHKETNKVSEAIPKKEPPKRHPIRAGIARKMVAKPDESNPTQAKRRNLRNPASSNPKENSVVTEKTSVYLKRIGGKDPEHPDKNLVKRKRR